MPTPSLWSGASTSSWAKWTGNAAVYPETGGPVMQYGVKIRIKLMRWRGCFYGQHGGRAIGVLRAWAGYWAPSTAELLRIGG